VFNKINRPQEGEEEKVIIIGGGGTGAFLAKNLNMHKREVVIIDLKKEKVDALNEKGVRAIHGNGTDTSIYKELKLRPKDYIVILSHTEERNAKIASILKDKLKHGNILTVLSKKSELEKLGNVGIESLDGAQVVATAIENLIFRPATYHTIFESFESFSVEVIKLTNKNIIGLQIKKIPFHQEGFVMMIKREGEYFVPHGDDYLQHRDEVVVFGRHSALLDYKDKLR
jgi:Trk K+ transport system NAD-binding subunit